MKLKLLSFLAPLLLFQTISAAPTRLFLETNCDKKVYQSSEPIAIALTVLNTNSTPVKLTFTSGKKYDFYLYRDEKLVWKWSGGKIFAMALSALTLEPKKPLTYVIIFNQMLPSGQTLEAGRYKIIGALSSREKEYLSAPIEIEIRK